MTMTWTKGRRRPSKKRSWKTWKWVCLPFYFTYLLVYQSIPAKVSMSYPVNGGRRNDVKETLKTHNIIPLSAFDYHNEEIKPEDLTRILKGALVSVTFTLQCGVFNPSCSL